MTCTTYSSTVVIPEAPNSAGSAPVSQVQAVGKRRKCGRAKWDGVWVGGDSEPSCNFRCSNDLTALGHFREDSTLDRRQIVLEERFRLVLVKNVTCYIEADRLERAGSDAEAALLRQKSDRWLQLQRKVGAALEASRAAAAKR